MSGNRVEGQPSEYRMLERQLRSKQVYAAALVFETNVKSTSVRIATVEKNITTLYSKLRTADVA